MQFKRQPWGGYFTIFSQVFARCSYADPTADMQLGRLHPEMLVRDAWLAEDKTIRKIFARIDGITAKLSASSVLWLDSWPLRGVVGRLVCALSAYDESA